MTSSQASGGAHNPAQNRNTGDSRFSERLHAAWWVWPMPLAIGVLLAVEVHMGYPGVRAWLPYLVLIPLAVAVPLWLGRIKVEVRSGGPGADSQEPQLCVGDAHVPLRYVEDAEVVPRTQKRHALGPELDPAAFVLHRPWVGPMVRVWLDDENDPTPYWMVSTRSPQKLTEHLRR